LHKNITQTLLPNYHYSISIGVIIRGIVLYPFTSIHLKTTPQEWKQKETGNQICQPQFSNTSCSHPRTLSFRPNPLKQMVIAPGRRKRIVVLLQMKHMSDQELPTTYCRCKNLRRFHHGSSGSWPAIPSANRFTYACGLCLQCNGLEVEV